MENGWRIKWCKRCGRKFKTRLGHFSVICPECDHNKHHRLENMWRVLNGEEPLKVMA